MKHFLFIHILLLPVLGFSQQKYFHTEIGGFAPTVKVGLGWELNERWDVKGGVGCYIFGPSLISYNLYGSYKLTDPEKKHNFNMNFGMLDSYFSYQQHASFGFGMAPGFGWKTKNGNKMNFRLGFVTGPAFESGERRWLTIPDFALEYDFRSKCR